MPHVSPHDTAAPDAAGFLRMLPLDIALTLTVIATISGLALSVLPSLKQSAHLTGVLSGLGDARYEAIEHIAVHGTVEREPADEPAEPSASGEFLVYREGLVAVAAGVLPGPGDGIEFSLGLRPAVRPGAQGTTVRWLCGPRAVPAGWQAPDWTSPNELPPHLLPAPCRAPS